MSATGRIICPTCHGAGRWPGSYGPEDCMLCYEDGFLDPTDSGYDVAVERWADRGVSPPPEPA